MAGIRKLFVPLFGVFLITGCAAQRYQPAPIVAGTTASQFESRSLADVGLRSFEEKNLRQPAPSWPPRTWDLQSLSVAALYFNPTLDLARARLARADAAMVTAGSRPNPTLGISPGVPSPYLLTLDFAFPIETAGKRGYRVQGAGNLDQAARLDLADSAWTVLEWCSSRAVELSSCISKFGAAAFGRTIPDGPSQYSGSDFIRRGDNQARCRFDSNRTFKNRGGYPGG